jgi:hypothetical protein
MERRKQTAIGETPIDRQRALRNGGLLVELACTRPNGAVERNSEESMAIARAVRAQFEDKTRKSPSLWKERTFASAED